MMAKGGTYEATYILDALLENLSALKPRRLHADTHGQSAAVFGPAYLLDIELMPRIRRWRKLRLCRADPNRRYPSIDRLFSGSVNRVLIREHYGMVMPLALAIQNGILAPSAVLARINSFSSRNRFALALQVSLDVDSRRCDAPRVHKCTTKIERHHRFAKHLAFGGEGLLQSNDPAVG
jgi:TnpA family transposase